MKTIKVDDENIIAFLEAGNWIFLVLLVVLGWVLRSGRFAIGVLAGGLLTIINFYWLKGIIKRALLVHVESADRFTKVRYILRLAIIGIITWYLIVVFKIDLIGFLVGLSVIVINIFFLTIYRMTCKGGWPQ